MEDDTSHMTADRQSGLFNGGSCDCLTLRISHVACNINSIANGDTLLTTNCGIDRCDIERGDERRHNKDGDNDDDNDDNDVDGVNTSPGGFCFDFLLPDDVPNIERDNCVVICPERDDERGDLTVEFAVQSDGATRLRKKKARGKKKKKKKRRRTGTTTCANSSVKEKMMESNLIQ